MVLNTFKLKENNVDLVKKALKMQDFGTKNSIAQLTGLSVATCRNILQELLQTGEVLELEPGPSTGGRPSRRFSYNDNYAFAALLYLRMEGSHKKIFSSVVNMRGTQIYENHSRFDDITLKEVDSLISDLLESFPKIQVLSLGVPGIVQNGSVRQCDFDKLADIPLAEYLSEKFNRIVTVENDVNCTALGYIQRLDTDNPESLFYLYYPRNGIAGAGVVINGKIIRGKTDFAGEISYMPTRVDRKDQGAAQKNPELFAELIVDTILSVNCLINPECIVVSGQWFTSDLIELIKRRAALASPPGHQPLIFFERDIHDSYINGLKFNGLRKLSCGFEVVEK